MNEAPDREGDEEPEEEPVYQEGDIALFVPELIWAVWKLDDEREVYLNMDAILRVDWDTLVAQSADPDRLELTAEQTGRLDSFQAGKFWLEQVTASIELQIGDGMPVSLESIATPVVVASDSAQANHLNCEQSAIANLLRVLTRMGLDGSRILEQVTFARFRETPTSPLKQINYVPGKDETVRPGNRNPRIRKGERFDRR